MKKKSILFVFILLFILLANNTCSDSTDNDFSLPYTFENGRITFEAAEKEYKTNIRKTLAYNNYTLADTYQYKETTRFFQWEKIAAILDTLHFLQKKQPNWGFCMNYKNRNGLPPLPAKTHKIGNSISDTLGTPQSQAIPFYQGDDLSTPVRYGRDGSLLIIIKDSSEYTIALEVNSFEKWLIPTQYVSKIDSVKFKKAIFVDRNNQNITTLEDRDTAWVILSMNPATTGLNDPPVRRATPLGVFVLQEKKPKMFYLQDGTNDYGGFAPHATRFTVGAYIHGVPVNTPRTETIEYSSALGTTPLSHMCVRTPTSHAQFIYEWAEVNKTLVYVIE